MMLQTVPLADLLRQYRAEAHLSQDELAERAGVSARTIGDIETGVSLWPRSITISLLAEALQLGTDAREALRAAASRRGSKPGPSVRLPAGISLIGRERDVATVRALLLDPSARLVTVIGGPGIGKTSLAIATANEVSDKFGESFFIEFATLPDAILVPTKIALALGVREVNAESAALSLATAIGARSMLLVLDNFECVASAGPIVAELLSTAPNLKVLVTSRTPLHLSMERVINLRPLDTAASARLLSDRLRAVEPDAHLPQNDPALTALMRMLGGVPLAIGLAAPLLRTATAAELTRLKHPLDVLDAMRDAIQRSYTLLGSNEQRFFRALGIFRGCFTEEDAHYIEGGDAARSIFDTLRSLATLVDQNLVCASESVTDEAEFELHPLVSAFAVQMLDGEHETEATHLRLSEYCSALAGATPSSRTEPSGDPAVRAKRSRESAHFDAALGWLQSTARLKSALTLGVKLWMLWYLRGENAHGHAWICSLLRTAAQSAEQIDDALLADANWAAAGLAQAANQHEEAEQHGETALLLKRALGDRPAVASILAGLGVEASFKGNYEAARRLLNESLALRRELGDSVPIARTLTDLGTHEADEGDFNAARAHLDEALTRYRAAGRRMSGSITLGVLGLIELRCGSADRAESLAREAIRMAGEIGFDISVRANKIILARALADLDRFGEAESLALEVGSHGDLSLDERAGLARLHATIACRQGRMPLAARLLGAASTAPGIPVIPLADQATYQALTATVKQALSGEFGQHWSAGRADGLRAVLEPTQLCE
jgi:predicted ATPase/DNA-binding XRE family transcriptional regulator